MRYRDLSNTLLLEFEKLLEARVDWLRDKYVPLIQQGLDNNTLKYADIVDYHVTHQPGETRAQKIFRWILELDPDPKKAHVQWILNSILRKREPMRFEDLQAVPDALEKFIQMRQSRQLTPQQADINQYRTVRDLEAVVQQAHSVVAQASAEEDARARKESRILGSTANVLVVMPLTKWAAQYWGRPTEWCTAWGDPEGRHPKRTSLWGRYSKGGPADAWGKLYVIINQKNLQERWQLWWPGPGDDDEPMYDDDYADAEENDPPQFKDVRDHDIDPNELGQRYPELLKIFKPIVDAIGTAVLNPNPNPEAARKIVQKDPEEIKNMANPSEELQLMVVRMNGNNLRWIQNATTRVETAAVKNDPRTLKYVKNQTPEMQEEAIDIYSLAIKWVKDPSEDLQMRAVKKDPNAIDAIRDATEKVQWYAVKHLPEVVIWYSYVNWYPEIYQWAREEIERRKAARDEMLRTVKDRTRR